MNVHTEVILEAVSLIRKFPDDENLQREQLAIIKNNALDLDELVEGE